MNHQLSPLELSQETGMTGGKRRRNIHSRRRISDFQTQGQGQGQYGGGYPEQDIFKVQAQIVQRLNAQNNASNMSNVRNEILGNLVPSVVRGGRKKYLRTMRRKRKIGRKSRKNHNRTRHRR